MPITKYAGPSKKYPFDISDIGDVGTAFEIHIDDSVIRRGIVLSTNAPDCMWFAKLSVARTNGESQDLRPLFDGIPEHRKKDCALHSISMEDASFVNWVRTIPRPVRDLAGNVPGKRGNPGNVGTRDVPKNAVPAATQGTDVPATHKKKKRDRAPLQPENDDVALGGREDWEDAPVFTRVLDLESQVEFLKGQVDSLTDRVEFLMGVVRGVNKLSTNVKDF